MEKYVVLEYTVFDNDLVYIEDMINVVALCDTKEKAQDKAVERSREVLKNFGVKNTLEEVKSLMEDYGTSAYTIELNNDILEKLDIENCDDEIFYNIFIKEIEVL